MDDKARRATRFAPDRRRRPGGSIVAGSPSTAVGSVSQRVETRTDDFEAAKE